MAKKSTDPQTDGESQDPGPSSVEDPKLRKRKRKEKDVKDKENDPDQNIPEKKKKEKGNKVKDDEKSKPDEKPNENQDNQTNPPSDKKKPAPAMFTTREMGKRFLPREKFLKLCLREMLTYLVFLIIVAFLTALQHSRNEYYLSRVMTKLFVERKFKTYSTGEVLSYNEINTLEQVWEYFNHYLTHTDQAYWYSEHLNNLIDVKPSDKMILFNNKLIGRPRVRQLRVKDDSCTVPEDFKLMFAKCYAEYSSSTESEKPFGEPNQEGAKNPRNPTTAWNFQSNLKSQSVSGEISTYGGRGFYFDVDKNMTKANKTIREDLFKWLWLDRASRALILQFTTYNANVDLFFTLKLLLELPPTGGVLPSYIIYVEDLYLLNDTWDYIVLFLFVLFCIFVMVYTGSEIIEIWYFKLHYLDYFWNLCDLIILVLCFVAMVFFLNMYFVVTGNLPDLVKMGDQNEHACFDKVNSARENFITFMAILFFFTSIKLLKYMNFNHSMYQMQMTLSKATKDIACFSIIFFIVFITFAQLGHLLFGSQVRDFRSFVHSVFALLRTAVGDFDYHKIENVNHFLGPVYFFAYIFFIYFILVNMFLAIIIDTYSEVRTSIRDQRQELQISDIVLGWFRKMCCGFKKKSPGQARPLAEGATTTYDDIQNLLRRCGFNEMEVDLFLEKFDIPKDKQISQDEMREKLLTNFNMQPEEKGKVAEGPERDEVGEKLMARIRLLEDNITDVNYKIDLIDNKIDAIQQIRARRRATAQMEQQKQ